MSVQLLQDSMPLSFQMLESTDKDGEVVTIRGKFQQCDLKNRNGRIYPKAVWEKHLKEDSPFMKGIKSGKTFGHLEHPQDGRSNLNLASVKLDRLWMESDGSILGEITTLRTPAGETATGLFKSGLVIGISSRGRGSVARNSEGVDEVQEDFTPDTFDLVAEPSTPGADLTLEALNLYIKSETLMEGNVDIPEDIAKKVALENQKAIIESRIQTVLGVDLEKEKVEASYYTHLCNDILFDIDRFLMGESAGYVKKLQETVVSIRNKAEKLSEFGVLTPGSALGRREQDDDDDDDEPGKKPEPDVEEKWGKETKVSPGEKGKYKGRNVKELRSQLANLKKGGPHKKGSNEFEKMKELMFAIRAKTGWGKVSEDNTDFSLMKDECKLQDAILQSMDEGRTHDDTDDDTSTWDDWDKQYRLNNFWDVGAKEDPYDIGTQYEAEGDLSHVLDISVPLSDLSTEQKEKFDIFRPGESVDKISDAIKGAAEAKGLEVLNCSGGWNEGDKIIITVEFKGTPSDAKSAVSGILGQSVKMESYPKREDITSTHSILFHINPVEVTSLSRGGFDTPTKLADHLRKSAGVIGEVFTVTPHVKGWFAAVHERSVDKFKQWAQSLGFRFNEAMVSIGDKDMIGSRLSESVLKLIEGLRDRNVVLQGENDRLVTENSRLRNLNEAMSALYKEESMQRHQKALIEKYPILQKAQVVLDRAQTIEELNEKASIFLGIHGQEFKPETSVDTKDEPSSSTDEGDNRRSATQSSTQVSEGVPKPGNNGESTLTESEPTEKIGLFGDAEDIGSRMRRWHTSKK